MKRLFNDGWLFLEDGEWTSVTIPHTPKIEAYDVGIHFQGKSYYKKSFSLDKSDLNKRLVLEFEAIMQYCEIRVNGGEVVRHYGGYLPVYVDITGIAKAENVVEVMADNSDMPDVPPGKPLDVLDFCYFGGIYRNAWLHVTDKTFITLPVQKSKVGGGGVFVTYPKVSSAEASVSVKVNVENSGEKADKITVKATLSYKNNAVFTGEKQVALSPKADEDAAFDFTVDLPKLWSVKNPNLYDLKVELIRFGEVIESHCERVGIRSIAVKDGAFYLNGKKIKLYGTNRHQSFPYVGNAASDEAHYRDACLMKELGVNFVRLCHYPQSESFLSACDELGIMLAEPVPGWQWFRNTEQFRRIGIENAREMVLRDRNHPSIIMWEATLNESHDTPDEFSKSVVDAIRAEYPGDQCICSGDSINKNTEFIGLDICHPNSYRFIKGKEDMTGIPPAWNGNQYFREYGDWDFGGNYSTSRKGREEGDLAMLLSCWNQWHTYARLFNQPEIVGMANWVGIDYNRGYCPEFPICRCGAYDSLRRKKFMYEMMRSQGSDEAMVFIANYWENEQNTRKLVVFSNCDEVELLVNGKPIERRRPEKGGFKEYKVRGIYSDPYYWADGTDAKDIKVEAYGNNSYADLIDPEKVYNAGLIFDGGSAEGTMHPYYLFTGVPYEKGCVEAIGYIDGVEAARHKVCSYGLPSLLSIVPDDRYAPLVANANDFIFVDVDILDESGNPVFNCAFEVSVSVENGFIVGPSTLKAIGGKATFMLKAYGDVTLSACCNGMTATKVITTKKE